MTLSDNRRNALVPSAPFLLSLGTKERPLNTIYSSNMELTGSLKVTHLIVDGFFMNSCTLDMSIFGSSNRPFKDIVCSNLVASQHIKGTSFEGSGNDLTFSALRNSITPGIANLNIGTIIKPIDNMYVNDITATNVIKAKHFQGDGSLLQNITVQPDLSAITSDIVPYTNANHDIGSENLRFRTIYSKDIQALNVVQGKRLVITNYNPMSLPTSSNVVDLPIFNTTSMSSELLQKFGGSVDIQCASFVSGVTYVTDAIQKNSIILDAIVPDIGSKANIGTIEKPFQNAYIDNLIINESMLYKENITVQGNLQVEQTAVFNTVTIGGDITATNYYGNGQFIDNITHFGLLTSNIEPLYHQAQDIGGVNRAFRNLHVKTTNTEVLNVSANLNVLGNALVNNMPLVTHVYGIVKPKQQYYGAKGPLLFLEETVSPFVDTVLNNDGIIVIRDAGLYTIGLYGISTNRHPKLDTELVWYIEHFNFYAGKSTTICMAKQVTKTLILGRQDSIRITIDPSPNESIFLNERGCLVVTQDVLFPTFIENTP